MRYFIVYNPTCLSIAATQITLMVSVLYVYFKTRKNKIY